jgi:hypothetical protein
VLHTPIDLARSQTLTDSNPLAIPRNPQGIPLFPEVDLEAVTVGHLRQLLEKYFAELWGE